MSRTGMTTGTPGLQIERVKRSRGIDVWARPCRRPPCKHCHGHDVRIKTKNQSSNRISINIF